MKRDNKFMKKILLAVIISSALTVGFVNAEEVTVSEEEIAIETIVTENSEEVTVVESTSQSEESVEVASTTDVVIETPAIENLPVPTMNINLEVYSATTTLFRSQLNVEACSYDGVVPFSLNALCAIRQSGLSAVWSNFGDDYFLDSINGATNDFTSNMYWLWFAGNDLGSVAMNKYLLSENVRIIVTIGRNPMKIVVATTTPIVGATTTISILEFGFDSSFSPVYLPSASSTIIIDGIETELDSSGTYSLVPTSTSTIIVEARKNGFLNPESVAMFPYIVDIATSTLEEREVALSPISGGGSAQRQFDISKAIDFLIQNQESNGRILSELYSDWAVFALVNSGRGSELEKLKNYLLSQPVSSDNVTDYERRAMSLMAININPYNGSNINYVEKIISQFDGTQIGDSSIVNDDVFAVIVLTDSGYGEDDEVIKKVGDFILSKQEINGSFASSVDMTGAGLQALSRLGSRDEVVRAKNKAKEFLLQAQRDDGGFGDAFASSWVTQGLYAIGELPQNIFKGGRNVNDYFASLQGSDGGLLDSNSPLSSRIWATSYAIPAYGQKTWNSIMADFSKPNNVAHLGGGSSSFAQSDANIPATTTNSTSTNEFIMREATTSAVIKQSVEIETTPDNPLEITSTSTNNSKYISPRLSSAPKKVDEDSKVVLSEVSTTSSLAATTINSYPTMQTMAFVFLGLLGVGISGVIFRRFVTAI